MPISKEQIEQIVRDAIGRGILSEDPRSPVFYKRLMLMRVDGTTPIFKHRDTRYYLAADGSHFVRWSGHPTLTLDEHQAELARLLTGRARLHGIGVISPDMRFLIGQCNVSKNGSGEAASGCSYAPNDLGSCGS